MGSQVGIHELSDEAQHPKALIYYCNRTFNYSIEEKMTLFDLPYFQLDYFNHHDHVLSISRVYVDG